MAVKPLSIKANMIWNSAGSLTYLGCQWLITIAIVRISGSYDDVGILQFAMTVVGVFGTFANYKMGTYQISDIRHENRVGEYLGFRCITLTLAFVACMVYAYFTSPPSMLVTIALFFVYKAVGLIIDIFHGLDQLNRRMDYIGKSFIAQGVTMLGGFSVVYALTRDVNASIIAMTVLAVVVLLVYDRPKAAQFEKIELRISRKKAFFFFKTSLPAVLAAIAVSAIFMIPKQYLAFAFGTTELGFYTSVAAPALVIQMGAVYLYGPLLDIFARHYFDGNHGQFRNLLLKTVAGIAGVAIVAAVVLEFIGAWALELLFDEKIVPYVYLLQPILLSTVMTAYLWFFGDLLIALRDFKANFIGNIAAFVSVIPLSFVCVNLWDMNGVSFAGAAACTIGVCILLFFLIRRIRVPYVPAAVVGTASAESIETGKAFDQGAVEAELRVEALEDGVQR